jgi:hypothetical protein
MGACQVMASEDRCPASGRDCRKRACELGGCQEARRGELPAAEDGRIVELRAQLIMALSSRKRLEGAIDEALALAGECEALLTHLHKAIGAGSSQKMARLRTLRENLREARAGRVTEEVIVAIAGEDRRKAAA